MNRDRTSSSEENMLNSMAESEEVRLDEKTKENLKVLRTMLGPDVDNATLLYFLDGAGGNIETAINHFFASDGKIEKHNLRNKGAAGSHALAGAVAEPTNGTSRKEEVDKRKAALPRLQMHNATHGPSTQVAASRGPGLVAPPPPSATANTATAAPAEPLAATSDRSPAADSQATTVRLGKEEARAADSEEKQAFEGEEFEVILQDSHPKWTLLSIFGRAVVQSVDVLGPAANLGIQRSDVLVRCGSTPVGMNNASSVVDYLTSGEIETPIALCFRRAANQGQRSPHPRSPKIEPSESSARRVATPTASMRQTGPDGLQKTLSKMKEAVGRDAPEEVMMFFLANAGGDPDRAVDLYFTADGMMPDFRGIVGASGSSGAADKDPSGVFDTWETYSVELPPGPFGMTVENVLERTVVVAIKNGGSASQAGVVENSLLVSVNGKSVTDLTHKETLQEIETAKRPLKLEFRKIPEEQMNRLRAQLALSVRQINNPAYSKRMQLQHVTFRDIVPKVSQILLAMPRSARRRLCQQLDLIQVVEADVLHGGASPSPVSPVFDSANDFDDFDETYDDAYIGMVRRRAEDAKAVADSRLNRTGSFNFEENDPGAAAELDTLLSFYKQIHNVPEDEQEAIIALVEVLGTLGEAWEGAKPEHRGRADSDVNQDEPSRYRSISFTRDLDTRLLALVLSVLESLLTIENHVVWDTTIKALQTLASRVPNYEVSRQFVPLLARLNVANNFTCRVATAALFPYVYPEVTSDVKVQLRGLYDRICNDDSAIVRRGAADTLAKAAEAVGVDSVQWVMLMFEKLAADQHDVVRGFCVDNCVKLSDLIPRMIQAHAERHPDLLQEMLQTSRLVKMRVVPVISNCAVDSSWQVRFKIVSRMPELIANLGTDYVDVLVDYFMPLLNDQQPEIRAEAAGKVGEVCLALQNLTEMQQPESTVSNEAVAKVRDVFRQQPQKLTLTAVREKIVGSILPAIAYLAADHAVEVRKELAVSTAELVPVLGPDFTAEHLVPIIFQLFEDPSPMVQATLASSLAGHGSHLDSLILTDYLLPVVEQLASHKSWRIRYSALECIAKLAAALSCSRLPSGFATICLQAMGDAVCDVRKGAVQNLIPLITSCGKEWLQSHVVPFVLSYFKQDHQKRLIALEAVETLSNSEHAETVCNVLGEGVLEAMVDKVPNVRLKACEVAANIAPKISKDLKARVEGSLKKLLEDNDMDVRWFAMTALEAYGVHVGARGGIVKGPEEAVDNDMDGEASDSEYLSPDSTSPVMKPVKETLASV